MGKIKSLASILIISSLFWFPVCVLALQVTLTSADVEAAKEFGSTHETDIEAVLDSRYGLGTGSKLGHALVVRTKWHKLALLAGIKAREGATFTENEQKLILEDPMLQIDIRVSGNSLDFARDHEVVLVQNSRAIKPEKLHADHFQVSRQHSKVPPAFPSYAATIRTYFSYTQLDPTAPCTLILKKNSDEQRFLLNLNEFK